MWCGLSVRGTHTPAKVSQNLWRGEGKRKGVSSLGTNSNRRTDRHMAKTEGGQRKQGGCLFGRGLPKRNTDDEDRRG